MLNTEPESIKQTHSHGSQLALDNLILSPLGQVDRHAAFYSFAAKDNYSLGLMQGEAFSKQAHTALASWSALPDWSERVERSKKFLDATKIYFPHYVEEIRGYAAGAKIDFQALWAIGLENECDSLPAVHCTTVMTNGGKLVLHNEDHDINSNNVICLLKKTVADLTVLELFYFNTLGGNGISINSHGYVQAINSLDRKSVV